MECVLFGRSPFIHQVEVDRINITKIGLNHFGKTYRVDHLFFFDAYFDGYKTPCEVHFPHTFPPQHEGHRVVCRPNDRPILGQLQDGFPVYGHKYYTASLAINWAILAGYTKLYLVGIDHVVTDTSFCHFDGHDVKSELTPESHQRFKKYVYNAKKYINIYQCNPEVAPYWDLPYKDVKDLYVTTQK